ncbi:Vgb family protein [Luethyella okanaganae]|uniref:Virginiamycin B lyase n=1 Tax=Luethyella okanaganae TaxID=69372 RepID=A0ABW1VAF0_9MICO
MISTRTVSEHRLAEASSGPYGVAVTGDAAVWFTLVNDGAVCRRDPNGTVTTARIESGPSRPSLLVAATEDSVWATDTTGNRILRVGTTGSGAEVLTTIAVPTENAGPFGITSLSDGTAWFTEMTADAVGRIDILGRVTEFPLGTSGGTASMIAASGEGLWFTLTQENAIGHIRGGDAAVRLMPLPTPAAGPAGIAVADDGTVWFTEPLAGQLGRVGRDGAITEFALPDRASKPHAITADPAGGCWFTLWGSNQVGRIVAGTDGETSIELVDLPTPDSEPRGLAVAPDGTVWVALGMGALAEIH